jgi:hypothetical protein
MKLIAVTALTLLCLAPAAHARSSASVKYPTTKAATKYSAYWWKAHHKCGRCTGRNIRRWGMRYSSGRVARATWRQIVRSTAQLKRLTDPPPPPRRLLRRVATPPRQRPAGVMHTTVRASLPDCTWRPESGGSYGAYNPSSGAYGKYQVIPSTWAAHCSDLGRDASGQEQCAARVYAAQGAGAWANC